MNNHPESDSVFSRVSQQLSELEKRDYELWLIVTLTGVLVSAGLVALVFPAAFMQGGQVHFEVTVSRELVLGLILLLALFNTYLVSRRSQLRKLREKVISTSIQSELIRLQSFTDPLTEVYNRRSLEDMAGRYISQAKRQRKPLTFMLIDVDRFREVNSRFGHLTGDFVLAEIASLLKASVRGSDAVLRYGGDEFLIILPDSHSESVHVVIDRIESYMAEWNAAKHLDGFDVTLSIGVGSWQDGKTIDEVLDVADRDMYQRKGTKASAASAGNS